MQRTIDAKVEASPRRVRAIMADLSNYPQWLDLVSEAETSAPHHGDAGEAWLITLRAKIGPFTRSKQLRMVRTSDPDATPIVFERTEVDGRDHSPWTLTVHIEPAADGTAVEVLLDYGGGLWTAPLEAVLGAQVTEAVPRLQQLAQG